jgi:hypothetical protein
MTSLSKPLRNELSSAVLAARKLAEAAAGKALHGLGVDEADPPEHLDTEGRRLRVRLRSQARQLGDCEDAAKRGCLEIRHLSEKIAYDHWHRLLFARFLAENDLLISPDHGVGVSLADCEELAPALGLRDGWEVATRFASRMLPQIFRPDDPADSVVFAPEDRVALRKRVTALSGDIFLANDSLGWCYQFWQAERKEEVNKAGNKIGADELPAVTQLFTEDYMVDFLLDNTLGAWHAGKVFSVQSSVFSTEAEARAAFALPACEWKYLRLIQGEDGKWTPAAGTFDGWPKSAAAIRALDPCMGSGHFVVAMFARLVALRLAEEELDEAAAVAAVIRDNLFGLEIDPRCTQIAAFNLALAAWRRVGHCKLPAMNLACSGLAPNTPEKEWVALAGDTERLQRGMSRLYALFNNAPVLGSLINPIAAKDDLLDANYHEVADLLTQALAQESHSSFIIHPSSMESAVTARGIAKAAEILAGQFTLVATNVPYLMRRKQDDALQDFCVADFPDSKNDLATVFIERGFSFLGRFGSQALVTPQNWLFLGSYEHLRSDFLKERKFNLVARLGAKGFRTPMWDFNVALLIMSADRPFEVHPLNGVSVESKEDPSEKANELVHADITSVPQKSQLLNPAAALTFSAPSELSPLSRYAYAPNGSHGGDSQRHRRPFWEFNRVSSDWRTFQGTFGETSMFTGREQLFSWFRDGADHRENPSAYIKGEDVFGKPGVVVSMMGALPVSIYSGDMFDISCTPIVPNDPSHLPVIWAYCSSPEYHKEVRLIDQALKVTNATLAKVPFDLAHWQKVAAEKYPDGLPKPFSSDPTQWLFNGHPAGSDQPLQVAVARLLGYRWPRQTGSEFPDCPALEPDGLEKYADADGIVCLNAIKGEQPAAERLRALLAAAFGADWSASTLSHLLSTLHPPPSTLDDWLRNGFFEQHCQLFHQRPFIWHIWDGLRDGFSVLVNYHKLNRSALEKLTYTYLGDWIGRQKAAVAAGEEGSDAKLAAAQQLQSSLKLIIEGEKPYDIFVRWKSLEKQPIGWVPDLNDGVRMNIRPFLSVPDVGRKGAGILRWSTKIKWDKDRGKDVPSAPWYKVFNGDRINDHHLTLAEKREAREKG